MLECVGLGAVGLLPALRVACRVPPPLCAPVLLLCARVPLHARANTTRRGTKIGAAPSAVSGSRLPHFPEKVEREQEAADKEKVPPRVEHVGRGRVGREGQGAPRQQSVALRPGSIAA